MRRRIGFVWLAVLSVWLTSGLLQSCGYFAGREQDSYGEVTLFKADSALMSPKYAEGFTIKHVEDGLVLLDIRDPEKKDAKTFHIALVDRAAVGKVSVPKGYTEVKVPVERAICMTSLQLSNFDKLDEIDRIAGITSTRHLFNEKMNSRIKSGKAYKIGIEGNFDNEIIYAIEPDVVMISPFKRGGYDALSDIGAPLLPHLGYKELTPLGQAEWVKLAGMLTGKAKEASEIFTGIETRYNELKDKTKGVVRRPTVVSGQMQGDQWYTGGGKSVQARLYSDAGARYFLENNGESGGVRLDFERVYNDAEDCDYWQIGNNYSGKYTYEGLKGEDDRYSDFKAWRNRKVIYSDMRGAPFYETLPMEPDVALADLIAIFHPELLPDHDFRYYHPMR